MKVLLQASSALVYIHERLSVKMHVRCLGFFKQNTKQLIYFVTFLRAQQATFKGAQCVRFNFVGQQLY
ncbi:hypothetical protein CesoFtcFv8_018386 [Champsocephalus esox]|uniref:Uncharacterized protein n=1 Tax=Champsocephalus esox TaxID=159716 RepID=A0AAN8BHF0_9TELE|nr:hypothetical protein CesoFtcFv8_018386 [Champsocephalus esox]